MHHVTKETLSLFKQLSFFLINFCDSHIMDKRQEATNENITDTLSTSIRYIVQNFRLVCLDVDIDESFQHSMNSTSHLQRLINTIDTFTDASTFLLISNMKKFL